MLYLLDVCFLEIENQFSLLFVIFIFMLYFKYFIMCIYLFESYFFFVKKKNYYNYYRLLEDEMKMMKK